MKPTHLAADIFFRRLPLLDYVACFFALLLLVGDQLLFKIHGVSVLPYGHLDKGYFFVGMFVVIVLCALITVELRSSALGSDAFTKIDVLPGHMYLPVFNTTTKLVNSYFSKKKNGESLSSVIWYATLVLVTELAFGCILAATIYVSYFRK